MAVFAAVNGLVLVNAVLHDPRIGYDADGYLAYIQALSEPQLCRPAMVTHYSLHRLL